MFLLRFDMRNARAEHYEAALDMARWAEENGALAVAVSEHHGVDDGYLPAPLALAAAMAARTSTLAIQVAALIAPLHDPIAPGRDHGGDRPALEGPGLLHRRRGLPRRRVRDVRSVVRRARPSAGGVGRGACSRPGPASRSSTRAEPAG